MIGVGVYTSLGFQVGDLLTGFSIAALWIVGGIVAMCGALVYGELAATLQRSGGEYHLLSAAIHPALGFLAGWLSITIGFALPVAAAAMAFGETFQVVSDAVGKVPLSLAMVALVTLVHLYGTKSGSVFQNAATVVKVGLIVVLIVAGLHMAHPQPITFLPSDGDWGRITGKPFAKNLIYVMYAYLGWNASAYIVGEVRNPARNVPLSVALGTAIVTVLYVLVNCVFLRAAPVAELAVNFSHVDPMVATKAAAARIFGAAGGKIIAGLICVGLISAVSAMTWTGPRVSVAMGEDWSLLRFLARRTRGGIPAVALLAQSAIAVTLLLTASFDAILKYIQFSLTISSSLTVAGIYVLRARRPDLPRPCRCWGYPVTPAIFLIVSLWMLWFTMQSSPVESLAGLATISLGLIVYALSPEKRSRADFEAVREVLEDGSGAQKIALSQPARYTAPPQL